MKSIQRISVFILLIFISGSVLAQKDVFKGDTIWYKSNKLLVEVVSPDFSTQATETQTVKDQIIRLQKMLDQMSIAEPAEDEQVVIELRTYSDDPFVENFKDLTLWNEKKDSKQLIVFGDGTIFEKDFGQYCFHLIANDMQLRIFVNQLSDLAYFSSESFKEEAARGTEALKDKLGKVYRKNPVQAWVDLRQDEPSVFVQRPRNKSLDMLMLSGGVGAGWAKNTFVSSIDFKFGLAFSRRGMLRNSFFMEWNLMYDFSNSSNNHLFDVNHFVSLGWEHNFSNPGENDKWYGFSFGYLTKRNNNFFEDNTYRFSMNKRINDTFSVKPELYFNDFFKNVYPGIRLSVAF
ncbi:hypothetical protein [Draconibacterium sediminis]|uniref:hypothetical protein n=1 Tax=Draconibacterium sediminis TaxID=1544798 RepID=UPI0026F256DF|nr:hypothetical protein [Draconibacterium sediminis]